MTVTSKSEQKVKVTYDPSNCLLLGKKKNNLKQTRLRFIANCQQDNFRYVQSLLKQVSLFFFNQGQTFLKDLWSLQLHLYSSEIILQCSSLCRIKLFLSWRESIYLLFNRRKCFFSEIWVSFSILLHFFVFLCIFRQKFLEAVWVPVLGRLGESQKKFFLSKLEMYVFN